MNGWTDRHACQNSDVDDTDKYIGQNKIFICSVRLSVLYLCVLLKLAISTVLTGLTPICVLVKYDPGSIFGYKFTSGTLIEPIFGYKFTPDTILTSIVGYKFTPGTCNFFLPLGRY